MEISKELPSQQAESVSSRHFPMYDRERNSALWDKIKEDYGPTIPQDDLQITEERIRRAWDVYEYGLPPSEQKRAVGFCIQPRSSPTLNSFFGDISNHFPALGYIPPELRHRVFNGLPPFETAIYRYTGNGSELTGSVICAPLSIDGMARVAFEHGGMGAMIKDYARPRIIDMARFAQERLGINFIGLGETMAAMTKYGKLIEETVPEIKVTTGHAYTTYLLEYTAREAAERSGVDLGQEMVGIIGCGSIGESVALKLDSEVKGFVLADKQPEKAIALGNKIKAKYPNAKVIIAEDNETLCRQSRFIIGAASNFAPLDLRAAIQLGTIWVDDSQPPMTRREYIEDKKGIYVWPTAQAPSWLARLGYNFGPNGLLPDSTWGCEGEVWTLFASNAVEEHRLNGPATPEKVVFIGSLAEKAGFKLADPLQSYGKPVSEEAFEKTREIRKAP